LLSGGGGGGGVSAYISLMRGGGCDGPGMSLGDEGGGGGVGGEC